MVESTNKDMNSFGPIRDDNKKLKLREIFKWQFTYERLRSDMKLLTYLQAKLKMSRNEDERSEIQSMIIKYRSKICILENEEIMLRESTGLLLKT